MDERFAIPGIAPLLARVRAGDRTALRELVTRYGGGIYSSALARTGNPDAARAIAKETLLDIMETPWAETDDQGYAAWIDKRIERNAAARASSAPAPLPEEKPAQAPPARPLPPRTPQAPPPFEQMWALLEKDVAPAKPPREKKRRAGRAGHTVAGIALCIVILVLLWMILGVLASFGVLPRLPLGYDWFNEAVFPLF